MEVQRDKLYGVISGDVVGSSKLDPGQRKELFRMMKEGSAALKKWLGKAAPLDVDIFGGDSWQVLVTDPGKSLAAGVFCRAHLRAAIPKCDTRVAIAVGTVDFVPGENVSEGDGEAFRLSGQLLAEGMGKRRMGFAASDAAAAGMWDLAFELIDAIVVHWTEKQARAVTGVVRGWTQEDVTSLWDPPIEQPSVNRLLRTAGWAAIERAARDFEAFWRTHQ